MDKIVRETREEQIRQRHLEAARAVESEKEHWETFQRQWVELNKEEEEKEVKKSKVRLAMLVSRQKGFLQKYSGSKQSWGFVSEVILWVNSILKASYC